MKVYHAPSAFRLQTLGEEIANAILHGVGVALAIAGLVIMGRRGGTTSRFAYVIYAAAMIAMFLASTLYHAVQSRKVKAVLRIFDHSAIYLLIAGTYTPFCVLALQGILGWTFLAVEWTLALTGIVLYAANWKYIKKIELAVYIAMGWAIVAAWIPLSKTVPPITLAFLGGGGVLYSLGALWYRKPNIKGAHVTWHVFVLAGAVSHWIAVWLIPLGR